jgi:hypothetical protein
MHCFREVFSPFVRYFKSVISTILRMAVTISLLNIHYTVILGEIDLVQLFKGALATILTKKIICFGNW